jgi:hypothetical protein
MEAGIEAAAAPERIARTQELQIHWKSPFDSIPPTL